MYHSFIKPLARDIKTFIADTLFPITCVICGEHGSFVCAKCLSEFARPAFQKCIACGKPAFLGMTHEGCKTPHGTEGLVTFFSYQDDGVAECMIAGKYKSLPGIYDILAGSAAQQIASSDYKNIFGSDWFLVPLPLSKSRKRWRGYNQAELICQTLSERLNIKIADVLKRTRSTQTQKDLKKDKRAQNVANAFALSPPVAPRPGVASMEIRGQNFILVDDVVTTGSTLREAAKVLKRAGAKIVWCLALAQD